MSAPRTPLREVHLLGLPLDVQARAAEQHAELMREFALLDIARPSAGREEEVPGRLSTLIDELRRNYGGIGARADAVRDAAAARGDATVDLACQVPDSVGAACEALSALLDEADEFCRAGAQLLTLAATPELVAFRHWYLGEFARQIDGEVPVPWSRYAAAHGLALHEGRVSCSA